MVWTTVLYHWQDRTARPSILVTTDTVSFPIDKMKKTRILIQVIRDHLFMNTTQ